jgi:hypothetical protein
MNSRGLFGWLLMAALVASAAAATGCKDKDPAGTPDVGAGGSPAGRGGSGTGGSGGVGGSGGSSGAGGTVAGTGRGGNVRFWWSWRLGRKRRKRRRPWGDRRRDRGNNRGCRYRRSSRDGRLRRRRGRRQCCLPDGLFGSRPGLLRWQMCQHRERHSQLWWLWLALYGRESLL